MKLTAAQKKEQVTVQARCTYTSTEDLEDALQTWGIDIEEYDDYDELIDALQSAIQYDIEVMVDNTSPEAEWDVEEISIDSKQLV